MSRPPEHATLHHSRGFARLAGSDLLWAADVGNTLVRRSALEHGLLRGEGTGPAAERSTALVRAAIERLKRTVMERKVDFLRRMIEISMGDMAARVIA